VLSEAGITTKDTGVFSIGKELMVKFEENVVQSSSVDPINAHVSAATAFESHLGRTPGMWYMFKKS
jgi:hypothetical protein